jgi:hypothetical protein
VPEDLESRKARRRVVWGFAKDATVNRMSSTLAAVPLDGVLGYLNFSQGTPDARVQKQIN